MILSDTGIKRALKSGQIKIEPDPQPDHFQTSAVDILLGNSFRAWDLDLLTTQGFEGVLNLAEQRFAVTAQMFSKEVKRESDGSVILPPYRKVPQVMLCQTQGRLVLDPKSCLAARVEGRSSLARLGVMVHLTAPTIHAGFSGFITLEMINHGPFHLRLIPNKTVICQYIFEKLEDEPGIPLDTDFLNQDTPIGKSAS